MELIEREGSLPGLLHRLGKLLLHPAELGLPQQLPVLGRHEAALAWDVLQKAISFQLLVVMTEIRSSLASRRIEGRASPADRVPAMICSFTWSVICS